jgi:hypothetical protein
MMKTAIDKNESEFDRMKRQAFDWIEKHPSCPPFLFVALGQFKSIASEIQEPEKGGTQSELDRLRKENELLQRLSNNRLKYIIALSDKFDIPMAQLDEFDAGQLHSKEPVSDEDIEKYAKSFPGNLGNKMMDIAVTAGFIEGAKAFRDGKITPNNKG